MDIFYENSQGEKIYLDREHYKMLSVTSLFDSKWRYTTKNENNPKIVSFDKKMVEKEFEVMISGADKLDLYANLDNFLSKTDIDVVMLNPGKLYVNDYYMECYIITNTKPSKYLNTCMTKISISIVAENDRWVKHKVASGTASQNIVTSADLDYPYDYPYDYANVTYTNSIENDSYIAADFELMVYGSCINPTVVIGKNEYTVNANIEDGEILYINSITKKIYKTKSDGSTVNLFAARDKDSYIFEKIATGNNVIVLNADFGFKLTLFMERSEPKWT